MSRTVQDTTPKDWDDALSARTTTPTPTPRPLETLIAECEAEAREWLVARSLYSASDRRFYARILSDHGRANAAYGPTPHAALEAAMRAAGIESIGG